MRSACLFLILAVLVSPATAAEPHRSFYDLPSSNGWGAVVVDLQRARAHHWRDHLFATEEPRVDAAGAEVWTNDQPESVWSRDLMFDAYFGVRSEGSQGWMAELPVDLDASGWAPGSSLLRMVQTRGDLRVTTWVWAPWELARSATVMVLEVENVGADPVLDLAAFSIQNLHLGEGRPGPTQEIGAQNETVVIDAARGATEERGFAGVVATVPLAPVAAATSWHPGAAGANPYAVVASGALADLEGASGNQGVHDDSVAYLQWTHGALEAGETAWFGLAMAHDGDPFAGAAVTADLDAWIAGRGPSTLVADAIAAWETFQAGLSLPDGLSSTEERLYRQSAVVLRMAQVREHETYLREWLAQDGEPRYSAFATTLPARVSHLASGAVLASLPPGQWTYAWPRDGAYAVVGMAQAGMQAEAKAALAFLLDAETDRYRTYAELDGVPVQPYAISLCRHHGFGIEESDTTGGGDFNFEFDGAGLFLWALDEYVRATGDWSLVEDRWERIRDAVAGFLPPLIDPANGLIVADSSIWEHHWLGNQRQWAYTTITAARGLCAAAAFAEHQGDSALAASWRADGLALRASLLAWLQAPDRSIAQTLEELEAGSGYSDGATIEAVAMGLLDPAGAVGAATLQAMIEGLQTAEGPGFSRNDDAWDAHALSPWGSSYDSDEWVVIDLRASVAARALGEDALADALLGWITAQSAANYDAIGETYDPVTGDYTNNAPMVGFGAGAYITALHHRAGDLVIEPACGEWAVEPPPPGDDDDTTAGDDDDSAVAPGDDDDSAVAPGDDDDDVRGCGCGHVQGAPGWGLAALLLLGALQHLGHRRRSALEGGA